MATMLIIHHRVSDYDRWKAVFDSRADARREQGCQRHWVYRSVEDPNDVVVSTEWKSHEAARSFLADPARTEAMQRAGVEGQPSLTWVGDETESHEY